MKNVLRLFAVILALGALVQSVYAYKSNFQEIGLEQETVRALVDQASDAEFMTPSDRSELCTKLSHHMITLIEMLGGRDELNAELEKKGWMQLEINKPRRTSPGI